MAQKRSLPADKAAVGRMNIQFGNALNAQLDQATDNLMNRHGLIVSKTDVVRNACALYVQLLPLVTDATPIMTLADVQQVVLTVLREYVESSKK